MKIKKIIGKEIFDSRGFPTIQCQIYLGDEGCYVQASVPSGISVSPFEAFELRDDSARLFGKGVTKVIEKIEKIISPQFEGKEPNALEMDMKLIELDGTINKSNLGANTMLSVSMALFRAEAWVEQMELYELIANLMGFNYVHLPNPFFNIINGGKHTNNNLQIQEFMIIPIGITTFRAAFEIGSTVFHTLENLLIRNKKSTATGPEGGFAAAFSSDDEAFDFLCHAIETVNNSLGVNCVIALDIAASSYYNKSSGLYSWNNQLMDSNEMIEYYKSLALKYPLYSIEDGLAATDWNGWKKMVEVFANKIQIVGDDIFATNVFRIAQGVFDKIATSVIIKPNQIGTITETLQAIMLCQEQGLNTIISHRSSETEDTFIADLAVGSSCTQIKAGSTCRGERIAKYNRLLCIEDELMLSLKS